VEQTGFLLRQAGKLGPGCGGVLTSRPPIETGAQGAQQESTATSLHELGASHIACPKNYPREVVDIASCCSAVTVSIEGNDLGMRSINERLTITPLAQAILPTIALLGFSELV